MNRRKFSLSWGRKIFFGISWPLSSILTLVYLRSFIIPDSQTDWFYYFATLIGHVGLVNALVYFLLYVPVVLLIPTYYISRIWSLVLILTLNLYILADGLSFSSYQLHIYSYLSGLFALEGIHHLVGSSEVFSVIVVGILIVAGFIWLRGERYWRYMQGHFSNPVRNWYFVLILISLGTGQLLYRYSHIHPGYSDLFPFSLNSYLSPQVQHDNRTFFYPADDLVCLGKNNPNVVLLVIKEWGQEQLSRDLMPKVFHMKKYALSFNLHRGGSRHIDGGLFSLLYSVPSSYMSYAKNIKPAFYTELKTRKYDFFENQGSELRPVGAGKPFFISRIMKSNPREADEEIHRYILELQKNNLLNNTHILITGATSGASSKFTPLVWMNPDKKSVDFYHPTSHFDVLPSLMKKIWGCKKSFKMASVGEPLEYADRDWMFVGGVNDFEVFDFKMNSSIIVKEGVIKVKGNPRRALIFKALRSMMTFNRPW